MHIHAEVGSLRHSINTNSFTPLLLQPKHLGGNVVYCSAIVQYQSGIPSAILSLLTRYMINHIFYESRENETTVLAILYGENCFKTLEAINMTKFLNFSYVRSRPGHHVINARFWMTQIRIDILFGTINQLYVY